MEKLLEINEKLENLVAENDLVGELQGIYKEQDIQPTATLKAVLNEKIEQDRDLKIGILGRVKAGKSSFLNAIIFNGENILPKAATPMTAALTVLEYGDSFEAKVDFYTDSDIAEMKSKHAIYQEIISKETEQKLNELKQRNKAGKSESEFKEMAKKYAISKLKDNISLYAYYEQYEQILNSIKNGVSISSTSDTLSCSSYEELSTSLKDYVGSSGKYTPFTKSITLRLNEAMLKDLKIIDTPGINDPIVSREERTRLLIAQCDAVFLVSPSGQFLGQQDLELLNTINVKNGITEFHIIASQFDIPLHSPEIKGNGILSEAIDRAKTALARQQKSVFGSQKGEFDSQICQKFLANEVLFNSSVSIEIIKNFDNLQDGNQEQDENQKKVLGLLKKNYPDYFNSKDSSIANLKTLSNLDNILSTLEKIRQRKEEILKQRLEELISSKKSALNTYKKEIETIIRTKIAVLKENDLDEIKAQIAKIKVIKLKVITNANASFEDSGAELCSELKNKLRTKINELFQDVSNNRDNSVGSTTGIRTKTIDHGSGFLWYRDLFGTRYETKDYQVTLQTLDAGKIRSSLQNAVIEMNEILSGVYDDNVRSWKKIILKDLLQTLQESVGDENLDADLIKATVRSIIANITLPELSLDITLPQSLQCSGKLIGSECDSYSSAVDSYIFDLKSIVSGQINIITKALDKSISNAKIGDKFIKSYEEQIEKLAKDAEDTESSIKRYNKILAQLDEIE